MFGAATVGSLSVPLAAVFGAATVGSLSVPLAAGLAGMAPGAPVLLLSNGLGVTASGASMSSTFLSHTSRLSTTSRSWRWPFAKSFHSTSQTVPALAFLSTARSSWTLSPMAPSRASLGFSSHRILLVITVSFLCFPEL